LGIFWSSKKKKRNTAKKIVDNNLLINKHFNKNGLSESREKQFEKKLN